MSRAIKGLHHVTAIAGPAQRTLDFHTGPLRRRLVKTTVNFDAPDVYHLYYANTAAAPGTILTVFPFGDAARGRNGVGMATAFAYSVGADALSAASEAARGNGSELKAFERFGAVGLALTDPDGLVVEYVDGASSSLAEAPFHSVTLTLADLEPTARLLTDTFGYIEVGEERDDEATRLRLSAPGDAAGRAVDLLRPDTPEHGRQSAGSIHHVAFRADDDDDLLAWREAIASAGLAPTPVIDRQYFHSIYFREPGGVLFEIATDPPGFAVDEAPDALGSALKLPAQYEPRREEIEGALPPLAR